MKSRRSWLIGLALGVALFFGTPSAKAQPRGISYQGLLLDNGTPFNGTVQLDFYFTDLANNQLFHQTSTGVQVTAGVFNVILGDPNITPGGFPNAMLFNEQYVLTIVVNTSTTLPAQLLWSAPYALNSQRVGGLDVSPTPVNGDIFPMPLNGAGQISPTMLPPIPDATLVNPPITSINTSVLPDANGNVNITAGAGIDVVNGPGNLITISSTASGGGITGVFGQNGVTGGGTSGNIYLSIAPGGITHGMLANGAVTGQDITGIAGNGLMQDASGLLDVQVDGLTIGIGGPLSTTPNELYVLPAGIGTVQLANGSVTNAKIATPYINFTSGGGIVGANTLLPLSVQTQLGGTQNYDLNLGHTNTWTILQNFTNLTDVGTLTNTGAFAQTGVSTLLGATAINVTGGAATQIGTTNASATSIGVLGGTNTIAGTTTINASVNNPTSINTGNSNANVAIGNNTVGQTNSVTIGSGTLGTIGIEGAANINTTSLGAGLNPTSVGNTANSYTLNASAATVNTATTWGGTVGTTYTLTAGTSTSISSPTNTMTATTSNAINGPTNINVSLNNPTNINTGTSTGAVSIGNAGNTNTIAGTTSINAGIGDNTSINTVSGAGTVAIGNGSSTTNMLGATNINTTGASTTTIGSLSNNSLVVNAATTHNGTTAFNNNVTQTGGTTQLLNTQVNGTFGSTGATTLATGASLTNSFGTGTSAANTIGNASGTNTINGANSISGLTTYGTLGPDGNRVVINGAVSTPPVQANQWELIVNGDAQITGTLSAGNFSASTITATTSMGAPLGMFDNLTTYTASNTSINVLKGLNVTGAISANGGITSNTGTVAVTGNESVSGNETVGGTLGVTGATTLTTLTTSGSITDNGNNFTIGQPGGKSGVVSVLQNSSPNNPPYSYILPDTSGELALTSEIANIAPPTADNQTLYSTGAGTSASPYVWSPTSNVQNNGTSQFLITSSTTLQANGPINFGAGNFTANSATISLSGGLMSSTDVTTIGTLNTDQTWLTVQGFVTAWTSTPYTGAPGATNPPTLPTTVPFPLNDFESIVKGDEEVTGTLYTASEYSSLNASSLLRFDHAEPFTLSSVGPNTMEFSGAGTLAGTPVITIDNIPSTSWGEQVTGTSAAAGGIQVTGFSAGTGIVVDPTAVGINDEATQYGIVVGEQNPVDPITGLVVNAPNTGAAIIANTTGESINLSGAPVGTQVGLAIGGTNAFITGETILAGTTGLTIGTAPTSIQTTGTINTNGTTGTGSLFTGSAPTTYTLTVNNTGNGNNGTGDGLSIGGTVTSTGNSTIGTNSGTTNTFGNSSNTTNNIGDGGGTTANTIGTSATSNAIGTSASSNAIGTSATTNTLGTNAGTNTIGNNTAGAGTVDNNIGAATGGSTVLTTIGGTNGAISAGSVTNDILGTTNINTTGGTALTNVGNTTTATDLNWFTVNGVITNSAFPPALTKAQLISASGIAANQFEITDNGDELVTGTLAAGQVTTGLLSAPDIRFNDAQPYTAGGTMLFDGSAPQGAAGGTPVVTIGNIPAGSFGEQVNGSATGAGGIQVTGAGAGTGVLVDPFPIGVDISATTTGLQIGGSGNVGVPAVAVSNPVTGAAINATTTGLTIGATNAPATGETINSSADGLDITSGPNSISANNLITTATNVNAGGNTGVSTSTTGLYQIGKSTVLSNPGTENIFVGVSAGSGGVTGSQNSFVGFFAGASSGAGGNNTDMGIQAGDGNTGSNNTYVGAFAGNASTGGANVGIGASANATGGDATAVGEGSGATAGSASSFGVNASASGANSTAIGEDAIASNGSATSLGGSASASGSNSTALGYGSSATASNSTALGNGATVGTANEIQLGNTGVTLVNTSGSYTGLSQGSLLGQAANAGTGLTVANNGNSNALVVTGGIGDNATGTQNGLTFNTTGTATYDVVGTGNTWNITKAGVFTGTSFIGGTGNFTSTTNLPALTTQNTGAQTLATTANLLQNLATSSTAGIAKTDVSIVSTGTWNGGGATNTGLIFNVTGGTTNTDITGTGNTWNVNSAGQSVFSNAIANGVPAVTATNTAAYTTTPSAPAVSIFANNQASNTGGVGSQKVGIEVTSSNGPWTGSNVGISFNVNGGSTANLDVQGTLNTAGTPVPTWQVTNAGALTTFGSAVIANGEGNTDVAGSVATTNTIGSSFNSASSKTTINAYTVLDATGQTNAPNVLTIQNLPNVASSWGEVVNANVAGNNSQGIQVTATSNTTPTNATGASLTATGTGGTNTALSLTTSGVSTVASIGENVSVTGASTGAGSTGGNRGEVVGVSGSTVQNIGEDITVSGTASTAIRVNAGPNTGISFDASNAATTLGEQITGIRQTGLLLNFTTGQNGVNGESVDMTNATGGAYNGISVSNLNASSDDGITIGYTTGGNGGTGLAISMPGNGNGSGISLTNVASGSGIQVLGVSGAGYGLSVTGATSTGNIVSTVNATGGKGIVAYADGTSGTTALQVGNSGGNGGNVVSDGSGVGTLASPSNRWVDTYTLQSTDLNGANNTLIIYNNLVTTTSTILITVQGPQTGTEGYVTISGLSSGHFTVNTTASNWGTVGTPNVNAIHYMVVNH